MSDLSFSQTERRSILGPLLLVAAIAAGAAGYFYWFTPHHEAEVTVTHVATLPIHTSYATGSKVVGHTVETDDDLYVLATVRITDQMSLPMFLKDITGTWTTADGTDVTTSAIEKDDLASVYQTLPSLRAISGPPLLREIRIEPHGTAEGMVMLHYNATEADWKQRKGASVTLEFYHQRPITVPLPQPGL